MSSVFCSLWNKVKVEHHFEIGWFNRRPPNNQSATISLAEEDDREQVSIQCEKWCHTSGRAPCRQQRTKDLLGASSTRFKGALLDDVSWPRATSRPNGTRTPRVGTNCIPEVPAGWTMGVNKPFSKVPIGVNLRMFARHLHKPSMFRFRSGHQ